MIYIGNRRGDSIMKKICALVLALCISLSGSVVFASDIAGAKTEEKVQNSGIPITVALARTAAEASPEPTAVPTTEPTAKPTASPSAVPTSTPRPAAPNAKILANGTQLFAEPMPSAKVLTRLSAKSSVAIINKLSETWTKIQYGGQTGYVYSYLVEKNYTGKDPYPAETVFLYSLKTDANFTSKEASAPVISRLKRGTIVRVIKKGRSYHTVLINSTVGYIRTASMQPGNGYVAGNFAYVRSAPNASAPILFKRPKGWDLNIVNDKDYGDWVKVRTGEKIGYIFRARTKMRSPSNPTKTYLTIKTIHSKQTMYKNSNLTAKVRDYSAGTQYYYLGQDTKKITMFKDEQIGYFKPTAIWTGSPAETTDKLSMLKGTSWSSPLIRSLPKGTKVKILSSAATWSKISYGNNTGYVLSCYLKRSRSASEYTWKYEGGYKRCYDGGGNRLEDVSDLVSGPYMIKAYKHLNTVVAYARDGSRGYTIPVKAMIASFGKTTPTGTYYIPNSFRWLQMIGDSWAQWCTQIRGNYLFHSVPSRPYEKSNMALNVRSFNLLGTTQSLGCIRLMCDDAKWIYDNCRYGNTIQITTSTSNPLKKPKALSLPNWHTWDPTDPTAHYRCIQNRCH